MEIEQLCEKLKPIIGIKADKYWLAYLRADFRRKRELETVLNILYSKFLRQNLSDKKILLSPPPKEIIRGDYFLGNVMYNNQTAHQFGLREDEMIQHISVLGRAGSGKTNTIFQLMLELMKKYKPFLCLDWKRNYRELYQLLTEDQKESFCIFTVGKRISPFQYNPLIPPKGIPANMWLKKLNEIIAHAFYGGDGVLFLLQKAIDSVYKAFGVYDGEPEKWPTMHDVLEWLRKYEAKGREANWMASTLRAIASMCYGGMGEVLNTKSRDSVEHLFDKYCILELDALTEADKIFFIESLLLWIHHYRMSEGQKETFKHAIIIEEAHHILLKQKQELKGGETIVDVILREIRELGESIILVDQCAGQISNVALANTYCTLAFNTKHATNVQAITNCMLFEDKSKEKDYLGKLPIGMAVVKLQDRWTEPFLVKVPLICIKKGFITDIDVSNHMRGYFNEIPEQEPPIQEITQNRVICNDDRYIEMLKDIADYSLSGIIERYERLGLDSFLGNSLQRELHNSGLIKTSDVPTSKGRLKILELTNKGAEELNKIGHYSGFSTESAQHKFWKNVIADYFKAQGYEVTIEYPLKSGKKADVVVIKDKTRICLEIETGKSDIIENLRKDLEEGFEMIICVGIDSQITEKSKALAREHGVSETRIRFIDAKKFEKTGNKNLSKLADFVKGKTVTIASHYDCDGITSGAMIYHLIKLWAKDITVVTKGVPFKIEETDIKKQTDVIICTDIKPDDNLDKNKVFYIDHHPNNQRWPNSLHNEKYKSCSELIFNELTPETENPYFVFLAIAGYFGDSGKLKDMPRNLKDKATQLIPSLIDSKDNSYCVAQKYVSMMNSGMRINWNGDFILQMLCEINNIKDIHDQKHHSFRIIVDLKQRIKALLNLPIEVQHGKMIDYAIINTAENIQGMLAARNCTDRPLLIINTVNDLAVGSLRVPSDFDLDAGKYLQNIAQKIPGMVAGGHKKAGGISLKNENIKELVLYF